MVAAWKCKRGCVQPAASVAEAPCNGPNTESCSDNLSIMRTVESLLATAVNRCVARICNLAETRAPRPVWEGQPEAQGTLQCFKTRSILFGSEHHKARDTASSHSWMAK